jgi:UDP-glucose 4-epimerase
LKKIIITGVAGLLGSRMAEWILENHLDIQIIGIDDLSGGYQEHVPEGVVFHQLDLSKDNIDELFKEVSVVYHFAT